MRTLLNTTRTLLHNFVRLFTRPVAQHRAVGNRSAVILLCSLAALSFAASAQQRSTDRGKRSRLALV